MGVKQLQTARPRMVAVLQAQPGLERPLRQARVGGRAGIPQAQALWRQNQALALKKQLRAQVNFQAGQGVFNTMPCQLPTCLI